MVPSRPACACDRGPGEICASAARQRMANRPHAVIPRNKKGRWWHVECQSGMQVDGLLSGADICYAIVPWSTALASGVGGAGGFMRWVLVFMARPH